MAEYDYQQITLDGGVDRSAAVTPTASDTVAPDDRGFLDYENTDAAARTIEIVTPAGLNFAGADLPNLSYNLPATSGRLRIGPLVRQLADPTTGLITVTITATAGVDVVAYRS